MFIDSWMINCLWFGLLFLLFFGTRPDRTALPLLLLDSAIFVWKFLGLIFIFFNVFRGVSDLRAIFSLEPLFTALIG